MIGEYKQFSFCKICKNATFMKYKIQLFYKAKNIYIIKFIQTEQKR